MHIKARHYEPKAKGGRKVGRYKLLPIQKGRLSMSMPSVCNAEFCKGSVNDLMGNYGILHTDVMNSVWHVVHSVNTLLEF